MRFFVCAILFYNILLHRRGMSGWWRCSRKQRRSKEDSSQLSEGCSAAPIEFLENPGESVRVGFNLEAVQ